jgi:hypothetical protein
MGRKAYSTIKQEKEMAALGTENFIKKDDKPQEVEVKSTVITATDIASGKKKFFVPGVTGAFLNTRIGDDHFVLADEKTAEELKKHFADVEEVLDEK